MPKRTELPSLDRLNELLVYDPETGVMTAKVGREHNCFPYSAGEVMGYPDAYGYLKMTIDRKLYLIHRLAWKIMTGDEPPEYLDHKDRNRQNNRWANLRAATARQNVHNSGLRQVFGSGTRSVNFAPGMRQWQATITTDDETSNLGFFDTVEEAKAAYEAEAKIRHGEFFCDAEGPKRVFYEVIYLIDETFCDEMRRAAGRLASLKLGAKVSPEVQKLLDDIGLDITTALHDLGTPKYRNIRHRGLTKPADQA